MATRLTVEPLSRLLLSLVVACCYPLLIGFLLGFLMLAVEKPAHDLHAHEYATSVFTVGKLQGGYVHYFAPRKGLVSGVGGSVSAGLVPRELTHGYYRRVEPGFSLFFTVRPARHVM